MLAFVSKRYSEPKGRFPRVTHPCATKAEAFVRLACVRHAASVRSEPGSNSQVQTAPGQSPKRLRRTSVDLQTQASENLLQFACFNLDAQQASVSAPSPVPEPNSTTSNGPQVPPPAHPFSQHGINLSMIPPMTTPRCQPDPHKVIGSEPPVCRAPLRFSLRAVHLDRGGAVRVGRRFIGG